MKKLVIGSLLLLTLAVLAPVQAQSVRPELRWDADNLQVFVSSPEAVQTYLAGKIEDPTGAYAAYAGQLEQLVGKRSFQGALAELSKRVRQTPDIATMTTFDVENVLIPAMIDANPAIDSGLSGGVYSQYPVMSNPECYQVDHGTPYCAVRFLWWCEEWRCNTLAQSAGCATTSPIPCPVSGGGSEISQR